MHVSILRTSACLALSALSLSAQGPAPHFESPLCHPVRISADGARLYTVHPTEHRLGIWSLANPTRPVLLIEVPVGQQPVSVTERNAGEVWVVNWLSDSISVVSVTECRVTATITVEDEPADVAFASGRAFVSSATRDQLQVFDATSHAQTGTLAILGKDPRAMAVNSAGDRLYLLAQRSGNGTTILPEQFAPPQPPPTNMNLPTPPSVGLILRTNDPVYGRFLPYQVPDRDVFEINPATLQVVRTVQAVGTTNFDLVVDDAGQNLYVANTDARNTVRFEPMLRGHAIDSRVTKVSLTGTPVVTQFDLNPGVNYAMLPNPAAQATALAEPMALVLDESRGELLVAAHGTDRIGVLDLSGNVLARIDVSQGQTSTVTMRGPRGLAKHPTGSELYVYNRLARSLTVVDVPTRSVLRELPLAPWDAESAAIVEGRKFLYDARLSGNGTMSCASCHIDGDTDGLAWNLGDPGGAMVATPTNQPFPFNQNISDLHPMKGPMTTQTLRGLSGVGPLHWRGDRADFQAFNGAFDALMGGSQLSTTDMNTYAGFGTTMAFPPNPNQLLDRGLRTSPAQANEASGFLTYTTQAVTVTGFPTTATCATCHALPTGSSGFLISGPVLGTPEAAKVPQLRNLYRKVGFERGFNAQSKLGFGFTHDGAISNLTEFLALSQFNSWPTFVKDDLVAFLRVFDSGTAPLVGYQFEVDSANAAAPATATELQRFETRAATGEVDVVVRGQSNGVDVAYLFDANTSTYLPNRAGQATQTRAALLAALTAGDLLTFTGAAPGDGTRVALDRDGDAQLDGDEAAVIYGTGVGGALGVPEIAANSEARLGNEAFAVTARGTMPGLPGLFIFGLGRTAIPVRGVTLLVDVSIPGGGWLAVVADSRGAVATSMPIPNDPALVGLGVNLQYWFLDATAPRRIAATAGLEFIVRS